MKKIFLVVVSLMVATAAMAQDTIISGTLKSIYWAPNNPQGYEAGPILEINTGVRVYARSIVPKPTKIYGFVAFIGPRGNYDSPFWYDKTIDSVHAFDYFGLYESQQNDTMPVKLVSDTFCIHLYDSVPSYFFYTPLTESWDSTIFGGVKDWPPLCAYERYFDSAITVKDSFYVGRSVNGYHIMQNTFDWGKECCNLETGCWGGRDPRNGCCVLKWFPDGMLVLGGNWRWNVGDNYMLYPIIQPKPTPPEPEDTTAVMGPDKLLQRYTSVQPNPASGVVEVACGMGLTAVEAYSAQGECVARQEAQGISLTLDVAAWPSGTYVLRIQTPMGTVSRKLLVAH